MYMLYKWNHIAYILMHCDIVGIHSCWSNSWVPYVCICVVFAMYSMNIHRQSSCGWMPAGSFCLYCEQYCLYAWGKVFSRTYSWEWGCWAVEHKVFNFTKCYQISLRVGGITHTPRSNRRGPSLRILAVSRRRKSGVCPVMPVGWCLVVPTHSVHDGCSWPSFTCHWSFAFPVALPLCVTIFNSPFLWLFNCFLGVVYVFWIRILHQLDVR